jgi:hypothetical protein
LQQFRYRLSPVAKPATQLVRDMTGEKTGHPRDEKYDRWKKPAIHRVKIMTGDKTGHPSGGKTGRP